MKRIPPPPGKNAKDPYLNGEYEEDRINGKLFCLIFLVEVDPNSNSNPTKLKMQDDEIKNDEKINNAKSNPRVFLEKLDLYIRDFKFVRIDELFVFDKRSFCKFYCDTLLTKHVIINSFCYKTGITPYYIRLLFFFLELCLAFVLNAVFYNDSYISERNRTVLTTNMVIFFINLESVFVYSANATFEKCLVCVDRNNSFSNFEDYCNSFLYNL